ncbi:unnamed protein product [Rotaria magnacalcarata]|uniref:PurM-like C-terminal domain-containing protein n=1 Tax=Rotaria magnacalcarata TaxID=392030 RepID=A0A816XZR0_9BILA|nr:unnamed protein product [Rotaria magnacalcarata]CAF4385512.1 unnamed protein product [Rotaria magnacalcarata]
MEEEFALQAAVKKIISDKLIGSAHDVSEGGVFVTLTESGFNRNLGYSIQSNTGVRKDAFLFGEAQSRVIVSVTPENEAALVSALQQLGATSEKLGVVTEGTISIDGKDWGTISSWKHAYDNAIGELLKD